MGAIGALVLERIEETDDMLAPRVVRLGLDDLVEKLDFVDCSLRIVGG
jgi:hypothetical protein